MVWEVEPIPNSDKLYMRVHAKLCPNGLHTGIFREHGGGMSTDWEKYSTAEECRARTGHPSENGVIELVAGEVRDVEVKGAKPLTVQHTPVENPTPPLLPNRAHTDVVGIGTGEQKTEVRAKLFKLIKGWRIDPSAPVPT